MADKKPAVKPPHTAQQRPARGDAVSAQQQSLRRREAAIGRREALVGQRKDAAVTVAEKAVQAKPQVEQLNAQLREANQRLVVATIQAQTSDENAQPIFGHLTVDQSTPWLPGEMFHAGIGDRGGLPVVRELEGV